MLDWFSALLIGTVQGLLEWIPVSSERQTGIIMDEFMNIGPESIIMLGLALHIGTALAVFARFPKPFVSFLDIRRQDGRSRFFWKITIISLACAFPVLWTLEEIFESKQWAGMAITLVAAAGIILIGIAGERGRMAKSRELSEAGAADALLVGVAQAFAVLPGVTRSGLTFLSLMGRKFRGIDALVFTYLLSFPVSLAAFAYTLFFSDLHGIPLPILAISAVAAFTFGYFSLTFFIRLARSSRFSRFCMFFGGLSISLVLFFQML
ncbi:MAG: undecaprenyl-diphosphate phosphatase [Thermoplasmata archaeon]|nr:undecaprenyl-diphosphate phosphatase [Thermoplasmata archaeon]